MILITKKLGKMIKTFEQFHELDPYGEEDWNDENSINVGDFVKCVKTDCYTTGNPKGTPFIYDAIYKVIDVNEGFIEVEGVGGAWMIERFKKIKND